MMKTPKSVYVAEIKKPYKDRVYTTYLLRHSYREGGKVKQKTLANLSHLPLEVIELVREALKGERFVPLHGGFEISRTLAHGHVAAVRTMLRNLGLHEILGPEQRERDLVEAMIIARVVAPQTKLATTRWWHVTTLPEDLGVGDATEDDLYDAMDWLLERKPEIEHALSRLHIKEGGLILYDVTSSYYEGERCPLAEFGYNRDGKKGKRQIVYGIMTNGEGCPVAVEVYRGSTADSATVNGQVEKIKERFGVKRVVLAGDRGMLISARIDALKETGDIDWVSALTTRDIKGLVKGRYLQISLFDESDLFEISSPDFPGERLIACKNPFLAEERCRKREDLLKATEKRLDALARRVSSGRLRRKEKIGQALGRIENRYKVAKHFEFEIREGHFAYRRNEDSIRQEACLDGIYVIRTSVPKDEWSPEESVLGYKSLKHAEQAFRNLKSVLEVRPIHHRLKERVSAHIFLCLLAYYVEYHLRRAWGPLLFDDEEPGKHVDGSPVKPALRSPSAKKKAERRQREDGTVIHSFATLMADLGTVARNTVRIPSLPDVPAFTVTTTPTPLQKEAFQRVGMK